MSTVKDQSISPLTDGEFVRTCTYGPGCQKAARWFLAWTQKGTSRAGSLSRQTRLACDDHAAMYATRANISWPPLGGK